MAIRATHVPTGTDIVIGPYADPISRSIMDEVHGHCSAGVLECREHDDHPGLAHLRTADDGRVHGAWVYLQKRFGKWVLAHHASGIGRDLRSHEIPVGISDQHRWQQDYWQRAAADVGYQTAQEVVLESGTRLDVAITGPVGTVGVEVQHSALSSPKVITRTRKAARAGIPLVWSADHKSPPWAFKVPHLETNGPLDSHAPKGSWIVTTGPRWIRPARCEPGFAGKCWKRAGRGFCGGWHAVFEPYRGLRVDDVAERFPAGELVPLDTRRVQGVVLVSAAHRDLWFESFDHQIPTQRKSDESSAALCGYGDDRLGPTHWARVKSYCACGQRLYLIRPGRTQCEQCRIAAVTG